jgi:aryl-phospho-beta-D-glucosidase BglC (GH1 family)
LFAPPLLHVGQCAEDVRDAAEPLVAKDEIDEIAICCFSVCRIKGGFRSNGTPRYRWYRKNGGGTSTEIGIFPIVSIVAAIQVTRDIRRKLGASVYVCGSVWHIALKSHVWYNPRKVHSFKETHRMNRRDILKLGLAGLAATGGLTPPRSYAQASKLPEARYDKLPRWRGFNLLEKFNARNDRFRESDFQWISEFCFNFVRLPMDYRAWIIDRDWKKINDKVLEDVDEAVKFGEKYGIHANINFHRAPGYTVARPPEEKSVWTDPEAREVCAMHWATFAKRYKGISNNLVSFNLFNEPASVGNLMPQLLEAHRIIIAAIRAEDPNRLIICDGYEWGNRPLIGLADQKVAMATRGYAPSEISHYKASWVNSADFPEPSWPIVTGNGLLCQPNKDGDRMDAKFKQPMLIEGTFASATKLRMLVGTVSNNTSLIVEADGKIIFRHDFKPGPGAGEWKQSVFQQQWNVYQNVYDKNYEAEIPAGTKQVAIRAGGDDWLTLKELSLNSGKGETLIRLTPGWNQEPSKFRYDGTALVGGEIKDRAWLRRTMIDPWTEAQKLGIGVMVGEFGAFQHTPHDITLRWLEDMLLNWKEVGWGFALWNFRGSFGILDSGRSDVAYEDFHGHKLDRKMLTLLQKYG